jgi:hypothetical protein
VALSHHGSVIVGGAIIVGGVGVIILMHNVLLGSEHLALERAGDLLLQCEDDLVLALLLVFPGFASGGQSSHDSYSILLLLLGDGFDLSLLLYSHAGVIAELTRGGQHEARKVRWLNKAMLVLGLTTHPKKREKRKWIGSSVADIPPIHMIQQMNQEQDTSSNLNHGPLIRSLAKKLQQ